MHFFIDHLQLPSQSTSDSFGPHTDSHIFKVTSRFQLSEVTKAFACQSGRIIVQQSDHDDSLVNIILKPTDFDEVYPNVKYFIYRGILKESLLDESDELGPLTSESSDLITRMFTQQDILTDSKYIGYVPQMPGDTNVEDVFRSSVAEAYSAQVVEGEWIGDFGFQIGQDPGAIDHKIGFEIILESDRLSIDYDYLRNHQYLVDTLTLTGLEERAKKEEILSYIDPTAFFGLYIEQGVGTASGDLTGDDIYYDLLAKFAHPNRVYLDVRSERGYSYNFYQNYGDASQNSIQLGYGGTSPSPQEYKSGQWPIVYIDSDQSTSEDYNTLRFHLRIDDNRSPLIYFPNTNVRLENDDESFLRQVPGNTDLMDDSATDWTNEVTLRFPNISNGSSRSNIASYLRIYYFRQPSDHPTSPGAFLYDHYFNGAFCSINFNGNTLKSSHPSLIREEMNEDGTGYFSYLAEQGVCFDSNRALFYSKNVKRVFDSGKDYLPILDELSTRLDRLDIDNKVFKNDLKENFFLLKRDYDIDNSNVRIPSINYYAIDEDIPQKKEDLLLLGITRDELDSI
jgi:hypothetical protein